MNTCMKCFGSMNKLGHEIICYLCKDVEIESLKKQVQESKLDYSDVVQKLTQQIHGLETDLTSECSKSNKLTTMLGDMGYKFDR